MLGLPLHPLVVHGAVVLVPLVALGAVIMALSVRFSRRFGPVIAILGLVGFGATALSKISGEELAERVGLPEVHAELADPMPIIALALAVLVVALWLVDRGRPTNRSRPVLAILLAVITVITAVVATYWMIRVGHTGAEVVWLEKS